MKVFNEVGEGAKGKPGWVAVAWLLLGCSSVAQQMTANVDDYDLYRQTRAATTLERKLRASHRYLREMPQGRWRGEVASWFEQADGAYYQSARQSVPRLQAYLALLPDGPHAVAAQGRIAELRQQQEYERIRQQKFIEKTRMIERELARAEQQRKQFVAQFVRFTRHVVKIRSWGRPTWELDPRFIIDWRLTEPRARCRGQRCTKTLSLRYAIPEERQLAPRQAIFDVVLRLEQGGVAGAILTGPELFSRVGEAAELRPTPPGDVMARAGAISNVLQILEPVVQEAFPAQRCARQAVSPTVLLRECDGVRLKVIAPPSPEEDRIEVEPVE